MSLHGVPRYALETHAPTCMQRGRNACIHKTRVRVYVCIQVEEAKTSKRGKSKVDGWKRVWDFYGLPTFSLPSPPLSLFLFRCSIGIERGLRMPRATGGGKTPSFARSPPLSTLHRARQPLSSASFSPHPPPIPRRIVPPTIRRQPPAQSDPSTFMNA